MLLTTTPYYDWSDKLKRSQIKKEMPPTPFAIPSYDLGLKQRIISKCEHRARTVKEYCKNAMPKNYYLRLFNEEYTGVNNESLGHFSRENWMYFDFKYNFLYCPTPKVTRYLM